MFFSFAFGPSRLGDLESNTRTLSRSGVFSIRRDIGLLVLWNRAICSREYLILHQNNIALNRRACFGVMLKRCFSLDGVLMKMEWLTVHASQTQLQPWIQASVFAKRSNSWSVFYLSRVFIFVTTQIETRRLTIKSSQVHRLDVPIAFPNYRHEPIIKSIVSLSHVRGPRSNLPPVHSEC